MDIYQTIDKHTDQTILMNYELTLASLLARLVMLWGPSISSERASIEASYDLHQNNPHPHACMQNQLDTPFFISKNAAFLHLSGRERSFEAEAERAPPYVTASLCISLPRSLHHLRLQLKEIIFLSRHDRVSSSCPAKILIRLGTQEEKHLYSPLATESAS